MTIDPGSFFWGMTAGAATIVLCLAAALAYGYARHVRHRNDGCRWHVVAIDSDGEEHRIPGIGFNDDAEALKYVKVINEGHARRCRDSKCGNRIELRPANPT